MLHKFTPISVLFYCASSLFGVFIHYLMYFIVDTVHLLVYSHINKSIKYFNSRRYKLMRTYKIYVNSEYVGTTKLTIEEVRNINADYTITLKLVK